MSLNGLDTPEVKEAHDTAIAEPGGWFVLKYASRDVLEILGRGNGGIVEIRKVIAQYEDPSPLYGFLRYRRRNVIIKYLPEDCSRLAQARVTVHLDSICERFSPYDTIFEIADAKELKDTKLSAACSLHTASGSTSSSTSSLRRRRLMEIAEEEEEQRASKRQSVVNEENEARPRSSEHSHVALDSGLASSPEESQFSGKVEPPPFVGARPERPPSPAKSLETYGLSDSYGSGSLYSLKPKVKLGPRPSLDLNARQRSGTLGGFRPISALPAGFKMQKKDKPPRVRQSMDENAHPIVQELFGPGARDPNTVPARPHTSGGIQPPPIPETKIFMKPPLTPGAVSFTSARSSMSHHTMSPEKSRLKKAMQLREKKQKALLLAAGSKAAEIGADSGVKLASLGSDGIGQTSSAENPEPDVANPSIAEEFADEQEPHVSLQQVDNPPETQHSPVLEQFPGTTSAAEVESTNPGDRSANQLQKDGPGTALDAEEPSLAPEPENRLHASTTANELGDDTLSFLAREGTVSDAHTDSSHPASPLAGFSEIGNSTKASSLSDTTDETVLDQPQSKMAEAADKNFQAEQPTADVTAVQVPDSPTSDVFKKSKPEVKDVASEGLDHAVDVQEEMEEPVAIQLPVSRFSSAVGPLSHGPTTLVAGDVAQAIIGGERNVAPGHIPQEASASTLGRLDIPKSKFSTANEQTGNTSSDESPNTLIIAINGQSDLQDEKEIHDPETNVSGLVPSKSKQKRNVTIEPIRVDRANMSDDEDFLDEQQTATVQQARPMNISKSPITPVFPTQPLPAPVAAQTENQVPNPRPITSSGIPNSLVADSPTGPSGPAVRPMTATMDSPSTSGTSTPQPFAATRSVSNPTSQAPLSLLATSADCDRPLAMRAASSGSAYLNRLGQSSVAAPPSPSPSAASTSCANLLAKKTGVGSSISQRIKALEKLSAAVVPASGATERPQSALFAVRHQPSVRVEPPRSTSVAERATSLGQDQTPSPPRSRGRDISTAAAGNIRDRSGSISSRLSVFEGGNLPRGRPDSMQVTARIVKDSRQQFRRVSEVRNDEADGSYLDLKLPALMVDHEKDSDGPQETVAAPVEEPRKETILQRRLSKKEKRRSRSEDAGGIADDGGPGDEPGQDEPHGRRSSLSIVKDFIKDRRRTVLSSAKSPSTENLPSAVLSSSPMASPNASRSPSRPPSVHQSNSISGRLSISSRRSSTSKDRELSAVPFMSPTYGPETSGSGDESVKATEKKSRASRFIRRLSSSLSSSRKTVTPVMSPTVTEEEFNDDGNGYSLFSPVRHTQQQPTQLVYMGDVNVQFPDNLLWKRRTMCMDSQGFLILSSVQSVAVATATATTAVNGIKRYHLSDFCVPYAPEMEQQELPNSVCLDFVEGSSLQIACEDRAGQLSTLHALQDAHSKHTTFGR